jgi:hypothetical protein
LPADAGTVSIKKFCDPITPTGFGIDMVAFPLAFDVTRTSW